MKIDNYRTILKNGKRVKEHSYMTLPKFKSITSKGYKRNRRKRSHGYGYEGGKIDIGFSFIFFGTGFLSFVFTFGLIEEFILDAFGFLGGLLTLLFIGFLLHLLLFVLVERLAYSSDESISSTGQPIEKQHVVKNTPNNFNNVELSKETKVRLELEWVEWQKKRGLLK
ncbi:hypothetical protein [Neobacillus niacini]|uniref:hypothetical protein n=1 Tax=Neobacillus niacini TaxID=86668 RepID=UPI0020400B22|nr:hypothetical protein [Neobacillus niacini]MCM3690967.1 hypothetical protein [Neobacillus niacini]